MSYRELNSIIEKIESDKIKDRSEGVSRFRDFINQSRNIKSLSKDNDHSWIKTLQSLFGLVIVERNIYYKKPGPPAQKRLEDAAQLVQHSIQKVHHLLSRKGIKAVFTHLTQMVAIGGKPQHYALVYLKTLRFLLNYPPHLEHLDEKQWTDIVSLCFSAVLRDKIKIGQDFADDAAMEVDESDDEFQSLGALRATPADAEPVASTSRRRNATQEDIELVGCIETSFRSHSAPFIKYSTVIFRKFLRFFRQFPAETTAHVAALTALNRAFAELELNDQGTMTEVGVLLWPHILDLWSTKNPQLKEQSVMALRYLFPFVAPKGKGDPLVDTRVRPLFEAVLSEPTIRWRESFELNVDSLNLGVESEEEILVGSNAFGTRTFRIGSDFSEKHAVAWAVLELGADSLARLYGLSETSHPAETGNDPSNSEGGGRNKRRKIEDPLETFNESLLLPQSSNSTCFRVGVLLFLVERHWPSLHPDICHRLTQTVISLLSHEDLQVQSWAFLVAAAIARGGLADLPPPIGLSPSKRARQTTTSPSPWDQMWSIALRRISNPVVSRAAAHTANLLLATDRISSSLLSPSIESLAKDIDVQGPSFPSDAVCTLLEWCVALISSDVRLFHLRFPEKVFSWLSTVWKPLEGVIRVHSIGQTRPRADPLSPTHMQSLLARICGMQQVPNLPQHFLMPDCPIASMAIDMSETAVLRAYIDGRVPLYSRNPKGKAPSANLLNPSSVGSTLIIAEGFERRISLWWERTLDGLEASGLDMGQQHWERMTIEMGRRHLDLACLALSTEALFELNGLRSSITTIKAACVIISHFVAVLPLKKWQPIERANLLRGLTPLFIPLPDYPAIVYPVLLDPGAACGLLRDLIPPSLPPAKVVNWSSLELIYLRGLWKEALVQSVMRDLSESLQEILGGAGLAPPTQGTQVSASQNVADHDDGFGDIKTGLSPLQTAVRSERAHSACMAYCVRGLTSEAMAGAAEGPARVPQLVDAVLEAEGAQGIAIAEEVFNIVWTGVVDLRLSEAETILEHFGTVLLPSYPFARDERFALATLRFLECTAPTWIFAKESDAANDFGVKARMFCAWLTDNLQRGKLYSWKVRLRFTAFLDTFLSFDRTQSRWNAPGESTVLPTAILPEMLCDPDFRVRFRAATSSAQLFTHLYTNGMSDGPLFEDIRIHITRNLEVPETMMTQILCNANISIVSANRRRSPYILLLDLAGVNPGFVRQICAVLDGVAERIGLDGRKSLYMTYRRYYAHQALRKNYGIGYIYPFAACGFETLQDMRRADLRAWGSAVLVDKQPEQFTIACAVARRNLSTSALECFPDTVALAVNRFTSNVVDQTSDEPWTVLDEAIDGFATAAGCRDAVERDKLITSVLDEILAQILATMYEDPWPADGVLHALIGNPTVANTLKELLNLRSDIRISEPAPPFFSSSTIFTAYAHLSQDYPVLKHPFTVFSMIRCLLVEIHREPFVDDRRKLLINLAMAVALNNRMVSKSVPMLTSLSEGLLLLLPQVDLMDLVVSMLEWTFRPWIALCGRDHRVGRELCDFLVRTAHIWSKVALKNPDESVYPEDGRRFLNVLDDSLKALSITQGVTDAATAFFLWPWGILEGGTVAIEQLEGALASHSTSVSKMVLVHSFSDRSDFETSELRTQIMWKLLEGLSSSEGMEPADSVDLANLLFKVAGETSMPPLDELEGVEVAHIRTDRRIRQVVVGHLLDSLRDPNPELAHLTFSTLRAIFSVSTNPANLYDSEYLSPRAYQTAVLLSDAAMKRPDLVRSREPRSIHELNRSEWRSRGSSYSGWTAELAELLAECRAEGEPFYTQLVPLLRDSADIAVTVLPILVHSILLRDAETSVEETTQLLSSYFERLLEDPEVDADIVGAISDILTYLRRHELPNRKSPLTNSDRWLSVPWVLVAKAAARTDSYPACLLFLELAHEHNELFKRSVAGEDERLAQSLLYEIYANVDEPDGFYGRQSTDPRDALVRRFCHERRWSDAFGIYGSQYESATLSSDKRSNSFIGLGVVNSLASFGFSGLAQSILQPARVSGAVREQDIDPGLPYDLAWRTESWDLPIESRAEETSSVALYSALRSIHTSRENNHSEIDIAPFLISECSKLARVSLDLPTPDREAVATVLALREIQYWATLDLSNGLDENFATTLPSLSSEFTFEYAERILSTRISLLRATRRRERANLIGDMASPVEQQVVAIEKACLLKLSSFARRAGKLQASMNAVTLAHKLVDNEEGNSAFDAINEELSNVLWAQGEHATALALLASINPSEPGSKASVLARLGEWTSEAKMKIAAEIRTAYFDPAVNLLSAASGISEHATVFGSFAAFADSEYQQCTRDTAEKKEQFERFDRQKNAVLGEIERRLKTNPGDSLLRSQLGKNRETVETNQKEDERDLHVAQAAESAMLWIALENYSKALAVSDDNNDRIFRFCSLWLANAQDDGLHAKLNPLLKAVPSHKYVFLIPQLSARLSTRSSKPASFAKNMHSLVFRLCTDHPFHCFFPVHALRDSAVAAPSKSRSRRSSTPLSPNGSDSSSQKDRAQAAEEIFAKVKKLPALQKRIEYLELACTAYTQWANFELKHSDFYTVLSASGKRVLKGTSGLTIQPHFKIRSKLVDLPIPVSTLDLPLDPTGNYPPGSFPSIVRYLELFKTAGGIHLPKIVDCHGSDGKDYRQLLKGGDDIRQDAGIEQTFTLVNTLLKRDEKTRRRKLVMRTYRVIPLPELSGLIEFVNQTKAVVEVLTPLYLKTASAKESISIAEARSRLGKCESKAVSDWEARKVDTFQDILTVFPPVMRHVFFQRHKLPSLWFDMRVNYSRSVAVNSIVGHIIGLGDRHVSNILMDMARGDLISIDLGISFEQGKRLRIPETVPFRLTQNIIDGLGMTGVDGIFRRCSEETLRLLRERSTVILTILEVFKYDPLQVWAISAEVARQVQGSGDDDEGALALEELPDEADRALACVRQKLDTKLSVEYTVNQLILDATSPENLGRIFAGWQAYL